MRQLHVFHVLDVLNARTVLMCVLSIAVVLLGACARQPNTIGIASESPKGEVVEYDYFYDPFAMLGLLNTEVIETGAFSAYHVSFPVELEAEWVARQRIMWPAWYASGNKEEKTSAVGMRCKPGGGFTISVIVPQEVDEKGVKVILLSTRLERAYTLKGDRIPDFDPEAFRKRTEYRQAFIAKFGKEVSRYERDTELNLEVRNWTVYETPGGHMRSPWSLGVFRGVHRRSPRETLGQQFLDGSAMMLTPSIEGMAVSWAVDFARAVNRTAQGKCAGFHGACYGWKPAQFALKAERYCALHPQTTNALWKSGGK